MTAFKKTMILVVLVMGFASTSFAEDKKSTGTGQSVNCPAINTNQDSNKPSDTASAPAPASNGSTSTGAH